MQHSLPARAVAQPGESLVSLVRRSTLAMGYEQPGRIVSLTRSSGRVPSWLNSLAKGDVRQRLAELLGVDDLQGLTIHHYAGALVLGGGEEPLAKVCDTKTRLRYLTPKARVCPNCLSESEEPVELLSWSLRCLPVCERHVVPLVTTCPKCSRPLSNHRHSNHECRCGFDLRRAARVTVPQDFVYGIVRVADCVRLGRSLVPKTTLAASMYWLDRIRSALARLNCDGIDTDSTLPPPLSREDRNWMVAANALADWPGRLFEFLDFYSVESNRKNGATSSGVSRSFGRLLRDAAKLESIGHGEPAHTLRDYLLTRFDRGHLNAKVCLFRDQDSVIGDRVSQTAAADELGVSVPTVQRLVETTILEGRVTKVGNNGRSIGVISRESLSKLRAELSTAMSCDEAAAALGCTRHRVLDLINQGQLERAVLLRRSWRLPCESVHAILELVRRQRCIKHPGSDWIGIRDATRRHGKSGLTYAIVVALLKAGELDARRQIGSPRLDGLLLRDRDIVASIPNIHRMRDATKGLPLVRIAKVLFPGRPTKERVLRKLIALGMLKAERTGREWSVQRAELDRFQSTYCLAAEACQVLDRSRKTLTRWETEGRLVAAYGKRVTPEAGFTIYRRSDIDQLPTQVVGKNPNEDQSVAPSN